MSDQKQHESALSPGQANNHELQASPRSNDFLTPSHSTEKESSQTTARPSSNDNIGANRIASGKQQKSSSELEKFNEKDQDIIHEAPVRQPTDTTDDTTTTTINDDGRQTPDPFALAERRKANLSRASLRAEYPNTKTSKTALKKYYSHQNALIDQFLNSADEERLAALDDLENGPKVRFAINASFTVNFCLFAMQLYAAVSTGSLSLFATAADAFMDLVSSFVMWVTARTAKRPSVYKYPVGRTRLETVGIIMFCSLMTTVAVELIIESGRSLGDGAKVDGPLQIVPLTLVGVAIFSKFCLFCYCFALRRYPAARIFSIDHRNDLVVNIFGLVMSIVGDRFVWWLDPFGSICIAMLILFSWVSTAFEHVWLLVGKGAPREFVSKVIYLAVTHDSQIRKIDTCRAYHAGQRYYVELDVIMKPDTPLKISHDVSQTLQRKLEGLADVERAFVHVDYEDEHDVKEEHKPITPAPEKRRSLGGWMREGKNRMLEGLKRSKEGNAVPSGP